MGARASRRRHEGRTIRKNRRIWRDAGAGFKSLGVTATHTSKALNRFGKAVGLIYDGNARPPGRPGSAVLLVGAGSGHPSQMGVEAGRSAHSAAERVDAAAAEMGLRLLPWQREYAIAALEGRSPTLVGGKQCGRSTVLEVVKRARGPENKFAYVDEIHDA